MRLSETVFLCQLRDEICQTVNGFLSQGKYSFVHYCAELGGCWTVSLTGMPHLE